MEPLLAQSTPETSEAMAEKAASLSAHKTIAAIREEVENTFGNSSRVAHLLTQYDMRRDEQMSTLASLGPDVILSMISSGVLPAQLCRELQVSIDVFSEFIDITVTPDRVNAAEKLCGDSLVAMSLTDIAEASDRDEVSKARALADMRLKIAKVLNARYVEPRHSTAIQINNNVIDEDTPHIPFLQIVEPSPESLPELKDHRFQAEADRTPEPIPTEYTLFESIDE